MSLPTVVSQILNNFHHDKTLNLYQVNVNIAIVVLRILNAEIIIDQFVNLKRLSLELLITQKCRLLNKMRYL